MSKTSTSNSEPPIRREVEGTVVHLVFDNPESSANIFNARTLDALETAIDWVAANEEFTGLILETAKDSIFVAGADIKTLSSASPADLDNFLQRGQDIFDSIEALKIPTVAAIHGAALGGGLEVALACDWRIASDARATRLGLPETNLGILPAWGGSTRLPALIGLPDALGVILKGGTLNAGAALHKGVIDGIAARERLPALAAQFLARGKRPSVSHFKTNNKASVAIIRRKARANILKKTHGHYPAQEAAIEVACNSVSVSSAESQANEREAALTLAKTPAARNLMRVFFLTETAKRLRAPAPKKKAAKKKVAAKKAATAKTSSTSITPSIERVCVVGAGVMGAGIAHWISTRGIPVLLQDINPQAIARGVKTMADLRAGMVKRRLMTKAEAGLCADRITTAIGDVPLHRYDMIIEAAVENLEIKKKIFTELSGRCRPDAILATNTSALPIGELASHKGIKNPARILGLHFFNPVHRMKLVEVVAAKKTAPAAIDAALAFTQRIAKLPVLVNDSPGFIVNRILMPYLLEAGELFNRGIDPTQIDAAMLDFGMPMGPVRLLDEVGLDVSKHVAATMAGAFPGRFEVPVILERMTEAGQLGRKSGAGFYLYKGKGEDLDINPEAVTARDRNGDLDIGKTAIADRLSLLMINEAFRCLEEGVVADADSIDFAMIMGAGFAPFRGGPMQHARDSKLARLVESLRTLDERENGDRFQPSELLVKASLGEVEW